MVERLTQEEIKEKRDSLYSTLKKYKKTISKIHAAMRVLQRYCKHPNLDLAAEDTRCPDCGWLEGEWVAH